MGNDNHDQSVGGQGATDGLSGTDNAGTEGADSGQGVNKGQHGRGDQHPGGVAGETTKSDDKKNLIDPKN